MKFNKLLKQVTAVLTLALFIISCEDDFGTIGTDIVGEVNFDTELAQDFKVAAYSRNFINPTGFNGIQTSGTPVGVLGYYDDPTYGSTTSSLLTQVSLSSFNPDFGDDTVIDSVVFTLPYYSSIEETDTDGNSTYSLDSIFGNSQNQIKLSIHRSNYFLNSLDPDSDFEDAAVYYSKDLASFSGVEGDLLFEVRDTISGNELAEGFTPDDSEVILKTLIADENDNVTGSEVSERLAPRIRLSFKAGVVEHSDVLNYWTENLINQEDTGVLLNQNTFNDYFRGLYFKTEAINNDGFTFLFDVSSLNVTVYYSFTSEGTDIDDEGEVITENSSSISIRPAGVRLIGYDNDFSTSPIGSANFNDSQNTENGESNLYLKGGDGSIALIDLFGPDLDNDGVADQLEVLRECNILINEANLTFYVDQEDLPQESSGLFEPERIFIFDFDNNATLLDALLDNSSGTNGPVNTRTNHLGRLTREIEGDLSSPGLSYRIRLTQHINNIIQNDSTNVRLALSVSQNVTLDNTALIQNADNLEEEKRIPFSSVISPEGTILHGSTSDNDEKKLRLRLYYTITDEIDPTSPCGIALGL